MLCAACRDMASAIRKGKPACRWCMRVSLQKWVDGIDELRRIDESQTRKQ